MRKTDTKVLFWSGVFSQWERAPFDGEAAWNELKPRLDGLGIDQPEDEAAITHRLRAGRYPNAEAWMMAAKAWLMRDLETLAEIRRETDPRTIKASGRKVTPFDGDRWERACQPIVIAGSIAKFSATPKMVDAILATGNLEIVEGSPSDLVWGIGLKWDDPRAEDPINWTGRNLLGQCLMEARRVIAERQRR